MKERSKWKQMENDLSSWLKTFTRNGIHFRNSRQAIIGFPSDGFRSDGMLTDNKVLIAIEVECGQTHPDTNTGKYWLLYKTKSYEKIILFHIYTPDFNSYGWRKKLAEFYIEQMKSKVPITPDFNSYGWRKKLAEFYIEQMKSKVPIEYILLDFRNANDYHQTLMELKKNIKEKVREEFGLANIT